MMFCYMSGFMQLEARGRLRPGSSTTPHPSLQRHRRTGRAGIAISRGSWTFAGADATELDAAPAGNH